MISIPKKFFAKEIKIGNVYLLIKHKLTNTREPHYHIVMGKSDNELVLFSCCTKKLETILKHIKHADLPPSTVVEIRPDNNNKLPKNTYINCNNLIPYTIDELYDLSEKGHLKYHSNIPDEKIKEIMTGINDSPNVVGEFKDIINGNGIDQ